VEPGEGREPDERHLGWNDLEHRESLEGGNDLEHRESLEGGNDLEHRESLEGGTTSNIENRWRTRTPKFPQERIAYRFPTVHNRNAIMDGSRHIENTTY
jgi:hypothetical protein